MIKIAVTGARGRMGQRIINLAQKDKDLQVVFGLEKKGHPDIGRIIEGVKITDSTQEIAHCDCLIDFSTPSAVLENTTAAVEFKKAAVIGVTGLDDAGLREIKAAADRIALVYSPNMSVGVNLLFRLLKEAAGVLKSYRVEVTEAHHTHKRDAPSGTAKKIARILNAAGLGIKDEEIKAIREGEIIGDHRVVFESEVDRIELSHSAKTRDIFAQGALLAAKWVVGKPAGWFSMDDVLFKELKERK